MANTFHRQQQKVDLCILVHMLHYICQNNIKKFCALGSLFSIIRLKYVSDERLHLLSGTFEPIMTLNYYAEESLNQQVATNPLQLEAQACN